MSPSPRELRKRYRRARKLIGLEHQAEHAEAVARAILNSGITNRFDRCGLYFAAMADGELDTLPLLARLWAMGKNVACPVVGSDGLMDFFQVKPTTPLTSNRFGIPEPCTRGSRSARFVNPLSLSVVFMPLVAFDTSGTRLGMGAGYYDRYLGRLPSSMRPLSVGIAHEVQRSTDPLFRQPWDVPMDAVVTEAGWQPLNTRAKVV